MKGQIKKYVSDRGFGFITIHESKDEVYFRTNNVERGYEPQTGDWVEFEIYTDRGKSNARYIRLGKQPLDMNRNTKQTIPTVPATNANDEKTVESTQVKRQLPSVPAPYIFVPVVVPPNAVKHRLFDAVFHDGTPGHETRLSGELRCTLKALTPLLVGQKRYKASQIHCCSEVKDKEGIAVPTDWGNIGGEPNERYLEADKGVLEPLLLSMGDGSGLEEKRVIIPGSSLKGMLRHNLGAILGAPMERVGEQYFSYRPNLSVKTSGKFRYQCYPAVVLATDDIQQTITVLLLSETAPIFGEGVKSHHKPGACIIYSRSQKYRILGYAHGIDGHAEMANTAGKPVKQLYEKVLVLDKPVKDAEETLTNNGLDEKDKRYILTIPKEIVQQYLKTQDELANTVQGHLSRPPYSNDKNQNEFIRRIRQNKERIFDKNRLIYVEVELDGSQCPKRIVSFGHHFRYRWRYADTIRTVQVGHSGTNTTRDQVKPLPGEQVTDKQGKLSGARLLFGYAVDDKPGSGTEGLGKEDFSRLAGRIAINAAVEHLSNSVKPLHERFIKRSGTDPNSDDIETFNIPLKILGTPKASAVEHYLVQDKVGQRGFSERTVTYGDLPGVLPSESVLSGRKFYRHQPVDPKTNKPFELEKNRHDKQATLARFISKPNSEFRFTLRFKDLRLWEIGAVIVALRPDVLIDFDDLLTGEHIQVIDKAKELRTQSDKPVFALKLGYGRPLGLGSVVVDIDAVRELGAKQPDLQSQDKQEWLRNAVKAFLEQVTSRKLPLCDWLSVVLYAGRKNAEYPSYKGEIYNYHTEIRREHSKTRRLANQPDVEPLDQLVKPGYPDFPLKP